jgi:hypothetical protein
MDQDLLVQAFERLRLRHLAFRRAEPEELRELEQLRLAILQELLARPSLGDYYREAWQADSPIASGSGQAAGPAEAEVHYVASMQLRLMERAFHLLRLNRYANAPENQGWMNLFRRWGCSPRFNAVYRAMSSTLTVEFRSFYECRVRGCRRTIEDEPIHHPWLRPDLTRGVYMDPGLREAAAAAPASGHVRAGAGGVLDEKGQPGRDQPYERPSGGSEDRSAGGAPNE